MAALYWFTQNPTVGAASTYEPAFNPNNFVPEVLHPCAGRKFTYTKKASNGIERIEIVVFERNEINYGREDYCGIRRVWLTKLKEDTRDWYAQDKEWERLGKLDNYAGTWEAGVDGARPGIIMPANPRVGLAYQQEYGKWQSGGYGIAFSDC